MSRTTLRDVAARAGVSHQTVSNVLNDHPSLRPATRARVLDAIRELEYHPNQAARALRQPQITTLCCVFYDDAPVDIADPYRNLIQSAFIASAQLHGYSMTSAFVRSSSPEDHRALRSAFLQQRFGGALLIGSSLSAGQVAELTSWQLPAVLFDQHLPGSGVASVNADYAGGMAQLVAHHAAQGRTRLALILPGDDPGSTALERRQGFVSATRQRGLCAQIVEGDWTAASGEAAFLALWQGGSAPDAVLAGNDRMAAGALRAARHLGLDVPQQVAISGFDDFEFARYTAPALTTVQVPYAEMAQEAVALLAGQVGGRSARGQAVTGQATRPQLRLSTQLIVRESA